MRFTPERRKKKRGPNVQKKRTQDGKKKKNRGNENNLSQKDNKHSLVSWNTGCGLEGTSGNRVENLKLGGVGQE